MPVQGKRRSRGFLREDKVIYQIFKVSKSSPLKKLLSSIIADGLSFVFFFFFNSGVEMMESESSETSNRTRIMEYLIGFSSAQFGKWNNSVLLGRAGWKHGVNCILLGRAGRARHLQTQQVPPQVAGRTCKLYNSVVQLRNGLCNSLNSRNSWFNTPGSA